MSFIDRLGEYYYTLRKKGIEPVSIALSEKNVIKLNVTVERNQQYIYPRELLSGDIYGKHFFGMVIEPFKTKHNLTGREKYNIFCSERSKAR